MIKEKIKDNSCICKIELKKYKKAYNILICYFDSISDEEQPKVHKKLEKLGL